MWPSFSVGLGWSTKLCLLERELGEFMSGIAGVLHLKGEDVTGAPLAAMGENLTHRAGAGLYTWNHGPAGFIQAFNRENPHLPLGVLVVKRGGNTLALTAHARIDNRRELVKKLGLRSSPPEKIGDHHLILEAYLRWGVACPSELLGDFAFALWDGLKCRFFCARDAMGVRPFYYCQSASLLFFGSEMELFSGLDGVEWNLNLNRLSDFLIKNFEDTHSTIYQEVKRLPPAHSMTVENGEVKIRRYWQPDLSRSMSFRSNEEATEAFGEVFNQAVSSRLREGETAAVSLSGGLDSSSILAAAVETAGGAGKLFACSAIFPQLAKQAPQIDERTYIDAVIASKGVQSLKIEADRLGPLMEIQWNRAEPLIAPNLYLDVQLLKLASDHGASVLLNGIDGDSTISYGYERLPCMLRRLRWHKLFRECRDLARLKHWRLSQNILGVGP